MRQAEAVEEIQVHFLHHLHHLQVEEVETQAEEVETQADYPVAEKGEKSCTKCCLPSLSFTL